MLGKRLKNQKRGLSHLLKLHKAQKKPSLIFLKNKDWPVVNRMISDPEVRKILTESLAFENANSECERMIRPLKEMD